MRPTGGPLDIVHRIAIGATAVFLAVPAYAQPPERAAVVALDEVASARALDAEAARVLQPTQMTVLRGEELTAWIRKRREPLPEASVLEQFAPATQTIAKGVERFFYMSPDKALPSIQPVLDLAWHHPAVLSFRPDLADQIWQAGIILVRAYAASRGEDEALAQAERLVTLLPSRQTDPKIVPPDTRQILENARARLAEGGATLRLSVPDPEHCTLYLNGAPAEPQKAYVVDPSGSYFAHADCSQPTAPPIWRAVVTRDASVRLLVPPVEPQDFRPSNINDVKARREIEWYLQAVAELAETDVAVGVASATEDESVILARYDGRTHQMTWSDDDVADSIRRGMPRIFPEYAQLFTSEATAADTSPPPRNRPLDWPGVALVGGGGVAAGAGALLVVTATRQALLLDCAVNNPSPPQDADCSGLADDIYFDDFTGETRKVGSVRTGGVVLIGVGALAVGYGIYRLVRPRKVPQTASLRWSPLGLEARW